MHSFAANPLVVFRPHLKHKRSGRSTSRWPTRTSWIRHLGPSPWTPPTERSNRLPNRRIIRHPGRPPTYLRPGPPPRGHRRAPGPGSQAFGPTLPGGLAPGGGPANLPKVRGPQCHGRSALGPARPHGANGYRPRTHGLPPRPPLDRRPATPCAPPRPSPASRSDPTRPLGARWAADVRTAYPTVDGKLGRTCTRPW